MVPTPVIRDLIYFDFDKAASLFSQVEGGLLTETKSGSESTLDKKNAHKLNIKLYSGEFAKGVADKSTDLETRILHDDLLVQIEQTLFDENIAIDLNSNLGRLGQSSLRVREAIADYSYIKVEGWAAIEDYGRFQRIAEQYNKFGEFVLKCGEAEWKQSPAYMEPQMQLDNMKAQAKNEVKAAQRAVLNADVKRAERIVNDLIAAREKSLHVDSWLLDGLQLFINLLMPGRLNVRIFPFSDLEDFQVIANLKRECLVDNDIEVTLSAYGTRPDQKLTMLGLITSLPPESGLELDTMLPLKEAAEGGRVLEAGFRKMFAAFDNLEKLVRFSNYPNVTVYPIAVYRHIRMAATATAPS